MAGGLLAILDDVAMLLDDTATMSKVAAKKTAGLLGDDLAVGAERATGFQSSRELPVIWAITKGAFINKLIILPVVFVLSSIAPWLIVPILLLGGAYLSYEGAEKVYEWFGHAHKEKPAAEVLHDRSEILQSESEKIKSAIRTDFILSIEITVITLNTVIDKPLSTQILVTTLIAMLATVGVYGLVALIVRMDDSGFYLINRSATMSGAVARLFKTSGRLLVNSLPWTIKLLSVVGTVAMLLVGGGMFVHNIDAIHHALAVMPTLAADLLVGLIVGSLLLLSFRLARKLSAVQ